MAWNEPGKGQDPWGGGNKGGGNNGGGPPDLDEIWRRLRKRFGGGGGSSGSSGGPGGPPPQLLFALIPVILVIWLLTGFYIVQPGEKGVVLRFGDYEVTAGPGWHWHMPYPVASVIKVDTQKIRSAQNSAVMLTKDENIVDVRVAVQYRISNAEAYLFNVRDPDTTVKQGLSSAVREIVGTSRMNQVIQEGVQVSDLSQEALENVDLKESDKNEESEDALSDLASGIRDRIESQQQAYPEIGTRSRAKLPENITKILQSMLTEYEAGMEITAINVQYSQPPEAVQGAFEEAIKAREEEERKKNIARAYARDVVGRAEGEAAQILLQARGYREEKIARASGEAERFTALLQEYQQAPEVTRKRLYLESLGKVLDDSNLIMLGNDKGSPLMYMPLQEMLKQNAAGKSSNSGGNGDGGSGDSGNEKARQQPTPSSGNPLRSRGRGQ